jgi:hypothetical protein
MGKKVKPITGMKKPAEGAVPKSKAGIQKPPKNKKVAGFEQKNSDTIKAKGKKKDGPKIKKSLQKANIQARAALASGEVRNCSNYKLSSVIFFRSITGIL